MLIDQSPFAAFNNSTSFGRDAVEQNFAYLFELVRHLARIAAEQDYNDFQRQLKIAYPDGEPKDGHDE